MRNNATQTRAFSSSSSSSRSYSPSSSSSVLPQTPIRTMEQVWKDLSFFPHPPPPPPPINPNPNPNPTSSFRGVILQDFLAGPFKETPTSSSAAAHDHPHNDEEHQFPLPLPPTALSLNSAGLDFEYNSRNGDCRGPRVNGAFVAPGFADAVIGSPPNVGLLSFCDQNRRASIESGGDRRHKRMMKNRESAARSRARKQAHFSFPPLN